MLRFAPNSQISIVFPSSDVKNTVLIRTVAYLTLKPLIDAGLKLSFVVVDKGEMKLNEQLAYVVNFSDFKIKNSYKMPSLKEILIDVQAQNKANEIIKTIIQQFNETPL